MCLVGVTLVGTFDECLWNIVTLLHSTLTYEPPRWNHSIHLHYVHLHSANLKNSIRTEKENNERMVRDVEDSVRDFSKGLEDSLKEGGEDSTSEHEKRRWEDGLGVEDEVKDFIFDLQRSSRSARVRSEE